MPTKKTARKPAADGSTALQQRFALAYLGEANFNAAAAYKIASPKSTQRTCQVNGSRLLQHPEVQARIVAARDKLTQRAELSVELVMRQLTSFLTYDPRQLYDSKGQIRPMSEWPAEVASAVIGIKDTRGGREVKLVDKGATLDKAMRYFGLFLEDNRQRTDPLAEMISHIQSNGSRVQPKS